MPKCEACGGHIQGMRGSARPKDKCIDVNLFEFSDEVGRRRAKRTHFCSKTCAIRGLEEDMLLTEDDPLFWFDRHGEGPQLYPDAEVEPLLRRARDLLETAADLNNCDDALDESLAAALDHVGDGQDILDEYPDEEYRCEQASQAALEAIANGEEATDAAVTAAIKHGIPEKHGSVYGRLQEAMSDG